MMRYLLLFFFCVILSYGQTTKPEDLAVEIKGDVDSISLNEKKIISKNPIKASLYSAIVPGLGQWYNGRKIKAPVVLGIVGTGIGYTLYLENRYQDLKRAYIKSLDGLPHQYSNIANLNYEALGRAQDKARRDRDYAIAITSLLYLLNIIEAAVDAHLYDFKIDKDLVIKPTLIQNPTEIIPKFGLELSLKF